MLPETHKRCGSGKVGERKVRVEGEEREMMRAFGSGIGVESEARQK